ncbi:hypothetical protein A3C18_02450 [Candidatus Kaiserbacteria bacterium RIFCSPHIGHO2_02_FULL_54_11b]|uniref:TspO protein n=2 Tax=Candidatus Kaiseribacteriota TaxID=1752734 RepID=A0A1F6CHU5_9BACT|nr:MAG: hypothetical protein A2704_03040 [Candidatus Kaiserbacteria bacterium RIFCSPHIGHO2_01_FULL_54_36b]OGG64006.1 MAG: hypothetical protein A3C18_02450 [Candidatus Kaiserbacteria bacterium RIFCSPHIGHO2_02_FULL_54_11b]
MSPFVRVAVAVIASYGAGFIGYLFVDAQVSSWYASLTKPALTPSDSTFIFVWLVLYGMMAAALAIVWTKKPPAKHAEGWVRFFFVQLLFNASYTMFFFGFHAVLIAFVDLLFLGLVVLSLMASAAEIDRRVVYLLTPYFLWILFAAYLTLGIWWLN